MPAEIFDYVIPSTLYRYRSLRRIGQNDHDVLDRELRAIEEGYIWASPYMDMNDPMEGVFGALGHKDEEKRRVVEQLRWRKERTGICCFSETLTCHWFVIQRRLEPQPVLRRVAWG